MELGGKCGGVWSSGMVLPRMVLALLELVLRLASQSSSHEETNINTLKKGGGLGVAGVKDPRLKITTTTKRV